MRNCIILFLLVITAACQKEPDVSFLYYRHIELYGKHPVMGLCPIEHDEVIRKNGYVFTFEDSLLTKVEYYKEGKLARDPKLKVARILIEYKSDTTCIRTFENENSEKTHAKNGQYFEMIQHPKLGFVWFSSYDKGFNLIADSSGVFFYLSELYLNGLPRYFTRYDSSSNVIIDSGGSCVTEFIYNDDGLAIEQRNLDENYEPLLVEQFNAYRITTVRDSLGKIIESNMYGLNDSLADGGQFGVSTYKEHHNESGDLVRIDFYDNQMNLRRQIFCNGNKDDTLKIYYDETGNLAVDPRMGSAIVYKKYDFNNNLIEKRFLGADSLLMDNLKYGYAVYKNKEWKNGDTLFIEISYYDKNEKLVINKEYGYAVLVAKITNNGRHSFDYLYDQNRQLIEPPDYGFSILEHKLNSDSLPVESFFFGADGELKPIRGTEIAIIRYKYDDDGKLTEKKWLDKNEELTNNKSGFAYEKPVYNADSKIVKYNQYDKDGELVNVELNDAK